MSWWSRANGPGCRDDEPACRLSIRTLHALGEDEIAALLAAAERCAREAGQTLLVLDTVGLGK